MLATYLKALPPSKFILIQDSLEQRATQILEFILKHVSKIGYEIHFFVFEGNINKTKHRFNNGSTVFHDFTKSENLLKNTSKDLKGALLKLPQKSVIILDSLVHMIYEYNLVGTYQILNETIRNLSGGQQIISTLHTDLLEDSLRVCKYLEHLSTLSLSLEPNSRVHFTYKKLGGKVIKQIEEYHFQNGIFCSEPIKKPDLSIISQEVDQVAPEDLSTFRIGLSEKEKESRDSLILPYLPTSGETETEEEGGRVFYKFDDIDDWDEEDPDDDLDL